MLRRTRGPRSCVELESVTLHPQCNIVNTNRHALLQLLDASFRTAAVYHRRTCVDEGRDSSSVVLSPLCTAEKELVQERILVVLRMSEHLDNEVNNILDDVTY